MHPNLMLVGHHQHGNRSCRRADKIWLALRQVTAATSEGGALHHQDGGPPRVVSPLPKHVL